MSLIKGENVILYMFHDGIWKPVICGRDCSLTTNAEDIETSITGSGAWRTYEYVGLTWECTFDGVMFLDGVNELSGADIRAMQYSRQKVLIRYERTDMDSNVYTEEGYALITSVSDSGNFDDVVTFTVDLKGTGPLTIVYTPTPTSNGRVFRYEYTAPGGSDSFTDSDLINKDILDVVVDGIGRSQIITSGTPVGQEAKYYSGSGQIELPFTLDSDMEVYVLYQDI
jgi:predicted secreted protein